MTTENFQLPNAEELMAQARKVTGIDKVDHEAIEPLTVLLRSLNEESQLHEMGRDAYHKKLVRILANRLRMQRDIEAHPEILEEKIETPIFLHGMPRTGSTKAQKLLSMSGDFNWLPWWMSFNPALFTGCRDESPQPRINETLEFEHFFDSASPEMKTGHHFLAMEPEEESFLLEHCLLTPIFLGWTVVNGYLAWLTTQGLTQQFRFLRDAMKYLQWQGLASPSKRWLLKCPLYYGMEHELLDVFPDACLVMTHRHPRSTIASGMRLLELFFIPFTHTGPDVTSQVIGAAHGIERHLTNRKELPDMNIIDIDYREIVHSPEYAIKRIYEFCKVELSPESQRRMLDWNNSNPKDKHGSHVYSLEQFGLSEQRVQNLFADYIKFLEQRFDMV
jgi:hypothetical protein